MLRMNQRTYRHTLLIFATLPSVHALVAASLAVPSHSLSTLLAYAAGLSYPLLVLCRDT